MPASSLHSEAVVGLALLEERCNGLLDHLEFHFARRNETTAQELTNDCGTPLSNPDLRASLSWLEQVGAVETGDRWLPQGGTRYRATELFAAILRDVRIAAAAVATVRKPPRTEDLPLLVVSWPHSLPQPRNARWRSSRITFIDLLDLAKASVRMMFPFVERVGVQEVAAAIQRALWRGVTVTLLTRYLREPESPNAYLPQRIKSIGEPALSLFRPLHLGARGVGPETREVLHAKVMVVDGGDRGYVGSANLTGTALDESLEVGVLLRAHAAAALGALLKEIVALAETP